jgi:phage terminase Nu1 subunit (DNA packaging protein)
VTDPIPLHGWVKAEQLADHLGVDRRTIDNWRKRGLPSVKVAPGQGGARRFYMPEVLEWLREHREQEQVS